MSHYFIDDHNLEDDFRRFRYFFAGHSFVFTSNSGLFSPGHVDAESDLLIRNIPPLQGSLLDLGCGYGAVGIALGRAYGLRLTLADVNPRALQCAEINCRDNAVQAEILLSDCFANIPGSFDSIALNPPIHAGKAVVYAMFEQSIEHLNARGAFYIVMLEKHGAKSAMKKLAEIYGAGNCEILYKKKGEYIFCCKKTQ
jgi:16S rRNA (guanine1207-N2)-methyltransferase